jgi:hypothetical protein
MESIKVLEEKVVLLVGLIDKLKTENKKLEKVSAEFEKKNVELEKKLEKLELSLLKRDESSKEEQALTKAVVDDLIKSIDSLVG